MRLLKNRGDIYIPKSVSKSSKETKILYLLLILIVIFTVALAVLLSRHYATVADFFAEGEVTATQATAVLEEEDYLPRIEGKTNFLIMETDDAEQEIHYMLLLQADKDNLAYKVCALPVNMTLNGEAVADIFEKGGSPAVQTRLTEYLGLTIDYQIQFKAGSFVEFANKLGSFVYSSNREIRFAGGEEDDSYSLRITEGEQKLAGRDINNLMRYYAQEEKNYTAENELALAILTGLLNAENYENAESLFRLFIKSCNTNITVRDFENGKNALMVYCTKNSDITVYAVTATEEAGELTQACVSEMKGYFSE